MNPKFNVLIKFVLSSLALTLTCSCNPPHDVHKSISIKPNILFIISDDLSAEALGAYGNKECYTPHIDRLSKEGIQYHRMYSQYPVCGPSRAALMTGLYPETLGIMSNGQSNLIDSLLFDRASMAEHFKQNGYTTTRLGKIYHMRVPGDITAGVDGPDHLDSWDYRYNFKGEEWMSNGKHDHLSNESLRFNKDEHYNLGFGTAFYSIQTKGAGEEQPDYRATSKALDIIENHRQGIDQPFFLSIGYVRPHVPLVAPEEQFDKYNDDQLTLAQSQDDDLSDIPVLGITKTSTHFGIKNEQQQKKVLAAYYASVSFMDQQVGRIMKGLTKYGLRDNTIVVFTSDHGYHLGEHELWQKLSLHEESTRIPFILSGPNIKPSQSYKVCEQIDIYPTLTKLAHLEEPKHLQGKNLPVNGQDSLNANGGIAYSVTNKGRAIRTDNWTYIRYKDGSEELYDMIHDPKQFTNLAHEGTHHRTKMEMIQLLHTKTL